MSQNEQRSMRVSGGMAETPTGEEPQALTGKLYAREDGGVRGWLYDHRTGLRFEFEGVRDPRGKGYLLVGKRVTE